MFNDKKCHSYKIIFELTFTNCDSSNTCSLNFCSIVLTVTMIIYLINKYNLYLSAPFIYIYKQWSLKEKDILNIFLIHIANLKRLHEGKLK